MLVKMGLDVMKVLRITTLTKYNTVISLLKCVNSVTFLQWKSTTPLFQSSVIIKESLPGFRPLHLAMITGCIAVFSIFPPLSSDFCLHTNINWSLRVLF